MAKLLGVPVRMFFTNRAELTKWVKWARGFEPVDRTEWDSSDFEEWIRHEAGKPSRLLKTSRAIFDGKGALVIYTAEQWHSDWISVSDYEPTAMDEDDVPF